jgi:dolichol kinase
MFLLFGRDIAVASLFFLAVGDPVASAVGQRWGRVRIRYKTLEGSLAFFLFSCAGGAILGSTVLSLGLSAIIAGALLAALAELLSFHLDDNLTIPLASSGGMYVVKSVFIG